MAKAINITYAMAHSQSNTLGIMQWHVACHMQGHNKGLRQLNMAKAITLQWLCHYYEGGILYHLV